MPRPELGVFSRKWTLPILREVFALGEARFSEIRRRNDGLSDRILSFRLGDLCRAGLVERRVRGGPRPDVVYALTWSGQAAMRIASAFLEFGVHSLASSVYGGGAIRSATDL